MEIKYPEIGICGLSCRLCPNYQRQSASKCCGCKSPERIAVSCPFISCAIKKMQVEFCWDCDKSKTCDKWKRHREAGREHDSFKSYQKLEDDINFIKANGIQEYDEQQRIRESLLIRLLDEYNEGRSKSYYCIAVTVMEIDELEKALIEAASRSKSTGIKDRSRTMHAILDSVALKRGYCLSLRR